MGLEDLKRKLEEAISIEDYMEAAKLRDLINNFNEDDKSSKGFTKVTVEDLMDWMMENEEDVIFDGPYYFSDAAEGEFELLVTERVYSRYGSPLNDFEEEYDMHWLDSAYRMCRKKNIPSHDMNDMIVECMVMIINKFEIEKI